MSQQNPDVIIHFAPPKGSETFIPKGSIADVAGSLAEQGADVAFTRGLSAYEGVSVGSDTLPLWRPGAERPATGSVEEVRALRDFNGALGQNAVGYTLEQRGIILLNGPKVRELDDKWTAFQSGIFGDHMVDTRVVSPDVSDAALAAILDGQPRFFKPARSYGSRGVARSDRSPAEDIARIIRGSGKEYVMQPIIDSTIPFPSDIQYIDDTSREVAKSAEHSPKELRIFWFYGQRGDSAPAFNWMVTARFSKPEQVDATGNLVLDDTYAYVDRDTVPTELIELTEQTCRQVVSHTGQEEVSGAFDFVYGKINDDEPRWLVGEGNFWQPVPPKHPELRTEFVKHTADQILRIVNK